MMKDIPIVCSGSMVRALIREAHAPGTGKTETRRLAWQIKDGYQRPTPWQNIRPGDRLWVRENHAIVPASAYRFEGVQQTIQPDDPDMAAIYACGWDRSIPTWKPSIHMPRWASRLTLIVTAVKTEPLQNVTNVDTLKEGIERQTINVEGSGFVEMFSDDFRRGSSDSPRDAFRLLWIWLHGRKSWDDNPEVVAISFHVFALNIDVLLKAIAA